MSVSTAPKTLNDLFFAAVTAHSGSSPAFRSKRGGAWQDLGHAELHLRVRNLQAALRCHNIAPGDRVAIISENRPEWAITDLACLTSRCTDVPVYPTLPEGQISYILEDSGAKVVFCSTQTQLDKVLEIRNELTSLTHIVVFDSGASGDGVIGFEEFEQIGRDAAERWPDWETEAGKVVPEDLATLIYTSGTTGDPKGVMLSHGNITSNVMAGLQILDIGPQDECLSFLPLSHIFERMVGYYTMLYAGATINYASGIDAVTGEMMEIRPTVMPSVPRLYEKIYARVIDKATHSGAMRRAIFEWAVATGKSALRYRLDRRSVPLFLRAANRLADLLVFKKFRARFGGRLRFFVSGGAPLNPDICRFFLAAGLPILEGYGLTETSPVICVNPASRIKPGTVGPAIPGVEVSIAADGEILTRGPHVMLGYFNKPDATKAAIDEEGWFRTGDIGELDTEGYLRITDRKKDIIVTAGGKNIAPQPIEALLKTNEYLVNAVMIGDRRKFPSMLLVPSFPVVKKWAEIKGLPRLSDSDLVARPEVIEKLEREARRSLRDLAHFEMPRKFVILDRDFSIESGEMTPKMSVKRKIVEARWKAEIDALYEPEDA